MAEFDLSKQVGPLPIGAWIAVIAGGLGIAYFINRDQEEVDETEDTGPVPSYLSRVGTGGTGAQVFVPTGPAPQQSPKPPSNNAEWARVVTNWLIAEGYRPGLADNAMRKYISGMNTTREEQVLINLALKEWGAPPEPLPPIELPSDDEPDEDDTDDTVVSKHVRGPFVGDTQAHYINVYWDRVDGATQYRIHVTGVDLNKTYYTTANNFTLQNRPNDTWYSFNVAAKVNGSYGPESRLTAKTERLFS